MRHLITTVILIAFTAFTFGQIVNDDMTFFNYSYDKKIIKSNKIETVTIEMYFPNGKSLGKTTYHFDKEGLLNKQAIWDTTGIPKREFYFVTNSYKDLSSRIQNDNESNKMDTVVFFKSYDRNRLTKDSSNDIPISYNFEYSKSGKLLRTTIYSNFGLGNKTKRIIINSFDSLDRIIKTIEIVHQNENDLTGTQFSNRDIIYNQKGKIDKEVEKLNSENSWMANKGSITYGYDSNGNLTQILRTNAASYIYNYNDRGLISNKKMSVKLDDNKIETFDKYTYTFRE